MVNVFECQNRPLLQGVKTPKIEIDYLILSLTAMYSIFSDFWFRRLMLELGNLLEKGLVSKFICCGLYILVARPVRTLQFVMAIITKLP